MAAMFAEAPEDTWAVHAGMEDGICTRDARTVAAETGRVAARWVVVPAADGRERLELSWHMVPDRGQGERRDDPLPMPRLLPYPASKQG